MTNPPQAIYSKPMEKIALLADIHANLAALEAVIADLEIWSPDIVIVAGDHLNRGPQSGACLALVQRMAAERGWLLMRGNHERYVLNYHAKHQQASLPQHGLHYELNHSLAWTYAQVQGQIAAIAALPEQLSLDLGGRRLAVYHASVRHDRDGLRADAPADELAGQIDPAAAVFAVGHTHMPFVRRLNTTLLVNVGSVGLPFDGDQRAAYARLTRLGGAWHAAIQRVPYDLALTERAFVTSGMLETVGPFGRLMLRELQTARSLVFTFLPTYYERLHAGQISFDAAINEFLAEAERAA